MKEYICPNCRKPIYDEEVLFCHFCGESLRRSSSGLCGKIKYGRLKIMTAAVIVVLLIMFALWVL